MMNKKIKIILVILVIVLLIVSLVVGVNINLSRKSNEKYGYWVTNSEFLYDKAIEYLKEEKYKTTYDKDKEDYQIFYDYEGFGIKDKEQKKIVYMYILEESYYVKNEKLRRSEGSCIPYKFTFENNEVVNYEIPQDGSEYKNSIKEMFPDDIEDKVIKYNSNTLSSYKEVEKHYSYLQSTLVIEEDYNENAIAICGVYGGNNPELETNTIKGKYIDGYGDIYEYQVPYNEDQELLSNINDINEKSILKYKENKISSISKDDLNKMKDAFNNVKEKYSEEKIANKDEPLSFVKVLYGKMDGDMFFTGYKNGNLIDLVISRSDSKKENISEAGKDIIDILVKYELI